MLKIRQSINIVLSFLFILNASPAICLENHNVYGLSNLAPAKAVVIAIEEPSNLLHLEAIANFYSLIQKINSDAQNNNPIQTLILGKTDKLNLLREKLNFDLKLSNSENIPNLSAIEIQREKRWTGFLQDVGKMIVQSNIDGSKTGAFIPSGLLSEAAEVITNHFKLTLLPLFPQNTALGQGLLGGNIDSTPDGRIYIGDTLEEKLISGLNEHTINKVLVLPVKWLAVGHVDEVYSFIPSVKECNFALTYASPLRAMEIIMNDKNNETNFSDLLFNPVLPFLSDAAISRVELIESIQYFLRDPNAITLKVDKSLNFYDFDLTKVPKNKLDWVILKNLRAVSEITSGLEIFKTAINCKFEIIGLPVLFRSLLAPKAIHKGELFSHFANPINHLVLGKSLIVPFQNYILFAEDIKQQLSSHVDVKNVHFFDTALWHKKMGDIHCATQVIRSVDTQILR